MAVPPRVGGFDTKRPGREACDDPAKARTEHLQQFFEHLRQVSPGVPRHVLDHQIQEERDAWRE